MILYLDASAFLRILFDEQGDKAPVTKATHVVSSAVLQVEVSQALHRARITGQCNEDDWARKSKEMGQMLKATSLVGVSAELLASSRQNFGVSIRALDAIHVATALLLAEKQTVQFWTHDKRQSIVALSQGMDVRG